MILLLMGVSGSGKTTIGTLLAQKLGSEFLDADDFHPEANLNKMHQGIPLTDQDRLPWLHLLRAEIEQHLASGKNAVLACSALKQSYRDLLIHPGESIRLVFLHGSRELLESRLQHRTGHFMPANLLDSQITDLEVPHDALRVEVGDNPEMITDRIVQGLK